MISRRRALVALAVGTVGPAAVVLSFRLAALAGLVALVLLVAYVLGEVIAHQRRTGREALERWRAGQATPLASYTPQTEDRWSAGEQSRGRWAV